MRCRGGLDPTGRPIRLAPASSCAEAALRVHADRLQSAPSAWCSRGTAALSRLATRSSQSAKRDGYRIGNAAMSWRERARSRSPRRRRERPRHLSRRAAARALGRRLRRSARRSLRSPPPCERGGLWLLRSRGIERLHARFPARCRSQWRPRHLRCGPTAPPPSLWLWSARPAHIPLFYPTSPGWPRLPAASKPPCCRDRRKSGPTPPVIFQ